VRAAGNRPVVIRVGGTQVSLAPGEARPLRAGEALAVVTPDGERTLTWAPGNKGPATKGKAR